MKPFAPLLVLALAACTAAPAREAGREPLTIVSLNPCSDAVLAQVAGEGQLLAVSSYSHDARTSSMDLTVARRFRATSGAVEEVLPLKPDIVVSGTYTPPATVAAFRRLGIRVELLPIAATIEESEAQVRHLAAIAGQRGRGEELVRQMRAALVAARPAAGAPAISAVVWQSGGIVPGPDTLISDLLHQTGFVSQTARKGMKQAENLALESLVVDPPRLILSAGDVHGEEDRMLAHPALDDLPHTRRVQFEPSLLYCGGPTVIRAAGRLAEIRRGFLSDNTSR